MSSEFIYPFVLILRVVLCLFVLRTCLRIRLEVALNGSFAPTMSQPSSSGPDEVVKLYVGMLSRETTEEELRKMFEPYGEVVEVFVLKDKINNQLSRGLVSVVSFFFFLFLFSSSFSFSFFFFFFLLSSSIGEGKRGQRTKKLQDDTKGQKDREISFLFSSRPVLRFSSPPPPPFCHPIPRAHQLK